MKIDRRQITEDELQNLFYLIGSGIWYLQHVEDALSTCITVKAEIKEAGSVSAEMAEKLLSKHRRSTLGTSIRIAKERQVLNQELLTMLEAFKVERDWLVHRSLHENGDDLYLDDDRPRLFHRLTQFSEDAKILQKLIAKDLEDFVVSIGVSRASVHQRAISDLNIAKGTK